MESYDPRGVCASASVRARVHACACMYVRVHARVRACERARVRVCVRYCRLGLGFVQNLICSNAPNTNCCIRFEPLCLLHLLGLFVEQSFVS